MATGGDSRESVATPMTPERFQDRFEAFQDEPQQVSGVWTLHAAIKALPGSEAVLDEQAPWALKFSEKPPAPEHSNPLDVPYQSQLDNASGQGQRECFSSSCAMAAIFWGKVANDDEYNRIRARYGDTTDAGAQLHALRSLDLTANFITNATSDALKRQIDLGRPTPCGILHHGHVSAPSGGGHWLVVGGYTDSTWIVFDPYGEADLVNGGYTANTNGDGLSYSFKNFNPRWMVEGSGSGWMMEIYE